MPTTLSTLAAKLEGLGLQVRPSPEGTWLRVEGRFGARVDAEPPGLTAWLDGSRLGWMARFDSAEALARAVRRIGRLRHLHRAGLGLLGLAGVSFVAVLYGSTILGDVGWLGPVALLWVLALAAGWVLEALSRRAIRRAGSSEEAIAWRRGAGLGSPKGPPP